MDGEQIMDRYAVFHVDGRIGVFLFVERSNNVARWACASIHKTHEEATERAESLNAEWKRQTHHADT